MSSSMRPGVFTSYSVTKQRNIFKGRSVGIIGFSDKIVPGSPFDCTIKHPTTIEETYDYYNGYSTITGLIETVMNNVTCDICSIGVEEDNQEQYKQAFDRLISEKDIYCIISDNTLLDFALYAKSHLPLSNGPKLYITSVPPEADVTAFAVAINCERIAIAYPVIKRPLNPVDVSPALLASLVSQNPTATLFLSGKEMVGNYRFYGFPTEEAKNTYLKNGVCVFEPVGENLQLIRAVSSKTRSASNSFDYTYRDLAIITGLDEITVSLSTLLSRCIQGAAGAISLESIKSIVLSELVGLKDKGVISDFQPPTVQSDSEDATVCLITLCITLRRSVNQIYLNLNIAI